ncbi:retrovirus-related pol polyprotein from transposon TNT 1-94 [Tanacetum coccineum]
MLKTHLKSKDISIEFLKSENQKVLTDKKKLEDKYLDEIVCLKSANKVATDLLQKFQMPTHTIPMLSKKPKNASQDLHKDILGRSNPRYGKKAPANRHVARQCKEPKRAKDSQYFKDKMLLMEAKEKGVTLDAEAKAFLANVECTAPYDQPLAMATTNIFEVNHEDAYNSDVDEGPNAAAAFMANLSSTSGNNHHVNEVHLYAIQINDSVNYQLSHEMHHEEQSDSDVELELDDNTTPHQSSLNLKTKAKLFQTEETTGHLLISLCVSHIVDLDLSKLSIVLQRLVRSYTKDQHAWDTDETLASAEVSMAKMKGKPGHVRPESGFYEKLNALKFVPQQELSREQVYWLPANEIASQASNPATPVTPYVPKSLPPSQVLATLHNIKAVFPQFDAIIKERTTAKTLYVSLPCYEYTKEFALQQVVLFLDYFKKHVQTADDTIVKEVAEFKEIHYALEDEYEHCVLDNKNLIIEKKNLLIKNDSLIAECLERDICSIVLYSDVAVTTSSNCSCDNLRLECDREHNKVLELKAEISKHKRLITEFEKPSNWLERLPVGSITIWEDLTTRFLAQLFPPRKTAKLRNNILMFQQHHGESLSEAGTRFKDLLQKVPHHGIDLWLQATIEKLARYEDEGWNDLVALREGNLDYENPDIEQLLGVMKCKVDTLMKEAISLMGRSESIFGMTSNTMYQLPLEPSRQEEFENLVMNFILDQEEKVKKLEEYMGVIVKVEETLGIPMEVEPLDEPQLEDLGLNTCNYDITLSSKEIPNVDEPKPQLLLNSSLLDVILGDKRGTDQLINPCIPGTFKKKVVDPLTINTPSSPHMAYYHPGLGDPKKHYGFKPDLGVSRSYSWAKAGELQMAVQNEGTEGVQKRRYKARLVARGFTQRADDMLIARKSKAGIGSTKSLLKKEFDMKELGKAKKILDNVKLVQMPPGGHFKLSLKDCPFRDRDVETMSKVPYVNAVRSLIYLMVCTRPDVAYAVWCMRQIVETMWTCFVDSDYDKDLEKGRSITGYAFLVHECVGAIHLSWNHIFHEKTKHINVRYHFIREVLEANTVEVLKVGTEHNVADALTKVIHGLKLQHCLELLSVVEYKLLVCRVLLQGRSSTLDFQVLGC